MFCCCSSLPARIDADPQFAAWIGSVDPRWSLNTYRQTCGQDPLNVQDKESTCSTMLNAYYRASNVGVAFDHFWPKSGFWLIRDNQCIESVSSSPESVLAIFARVPELWKKSPYDTNESRETAGIGQPTHALFHILIRALHEVKAPNADELARIGANAVDSDYPVTTDAVRQTMKVVRYCLQRGEFEAFKQQTAFFLDKAEQAGYLAVGKQAGQITYDTHIRRFVSVGLSRACEGAQDALAAVDDGVAPAAAAVPPKPAGASPEPAAPVAAAPTPAKTGSWGAVNVVCSMGQAEACEKAKKTFLAAMDEVGLTPDSLNLVQVYVDYQWAGVLDGFTSHVSIPYQVNRGDAGNQMRKRQQVVATARTYQVSHADLKISCALGNDACLAPAHVIRTLLNSEPRYTAKSLRIQQIDIDYQAGFFQENFVEVAYQVNAESLRQVLDSRLDFLAAKDQVAASLGRAKLACVLGAEPCSQSTWRLGKFLIEHREFNGKVLDIDSLTIEYDNVFLNQKTMSVAYNAGADAFQKLFTARI